MLTDDEGNVTDTYTFDAFGNLTEKLGNTENGYLYRGEQYDSFTGLYYLRARYMNPSTGTFITMDEYAGSVFEPVSLHKYLYANANPVMFSDPSGYFSLGDLSASMSIQGVLNSMERGAVFGAILNSLLTALRGGTTEEIQQAMLEGFVSGAMFGGAFGIIGSWAATYWKARLLLAALECTGGYFAFRGAIQDFISASKAEGGEAAGYCAAGVIESFLGFVSMFSAANNANSAMSMRNPPIAQLDNKYPPLDPSEIANKIHNAERTGSGLSNDPYHRAAYFLSEEQLSQGKVNYFTSGDGVQKILLQVYGQVNGKDGIFEYILEPNGTVSHERFIVGGKYTGTPNQPR